jgi:WD40 repeat protein
VGKGCRGKSRNERAHRLRPAIGLRRQTLISSAQDTVSQTQSLDLAPPPAWRKLIPSWIRSLIWTDYASNYDAFLSYSWRADIAVAPAVQSVIQRFLCPWYRLRAKNVFRDLSCLPAGSSLEAELLARLDRSRHLLVLASEAAATSRGMELEARHWFSRERSGEVLVIVTVAGYNTWNEVRTHLIPPAIREHLSQEPLWISLSERREQIIANPRSEALRGEIAEDLKQVLLRFYPTRDWGQLRGEERAQRRRALGAISGVALTLFLLASAAVGLYLRAEQRREEVTASILALRANTLEYGQRPALAALLTALSLDIHPTQQAVDTAISLLAGPDFRATPLFGHDGTVMSVAVSRDGMVVVSGSEDGTIRRWNGRTGATIGTPMRGHEGPVYCVAISPEGTRIASGGRDGTLRRWDSQTGMQIGEQFAHLNGVNSVVFTNDGTHMFSGGYDGTIRKWDSQTGGPIGEALPRHAKSVVSLAVSKDDALLVSVSQDETLRVWDLRAGELVGKPIRVGKFVWSATFDPSSKRVLSSERDGTLHWWNVQTGELIGEPLRGHRLGVFSLALSPDGRRIASSSADRTIRLWDASSGKPIGEPLAQEGLVRSVAFTPDNARLLSGGDDKAVRMWSLHNVRPLGEPLRGHEKSVSSIAFSRDGKYIVSGSWDHTARVWNLRTRQMVGEPLRHGDWVSSVAISRDGTRVATGSGDTTVRIWDLHTGRQLGKSLSGHIGPVSSVDFSPDGERLVSGSWDNTLRLWNVQTGEPSGEPMRSTIAAIHSVSFSEDGKTIVSGHLDKAIRLWDSRTGQLIGRAFRGHERDVKSVAFSSDGLRIVSSSNDSTVRLWDTEGNMVGEPMRHEGLLSCAAINPAGTRIVSSSSDGTLRLWDARTGTPIGAPLRAHQGAVNAVAFNADGTLLASTGNDGTIRLWDSSTLESPALLHTDLCAMLHRNLNPIEWAEYVPQGERRRAVCQQLPLDD